MSLPCLTVVKLQPFCFVSWIPWCEASWPIPRSVSDREAFSERFGESLPADTGSNLGGGLIAASRATASTAETTQLAHESTDLPKHR